MSDYLFIESLFRKLIPMLQGLFSASEVAEITDFLEFSEYGLSLDTTVDIFIEKKMAATEGVIKELEVAMELSPMDYSGRLPGH